MNKEIARSIDRGLKQAIEYQQGNKKGSKTYVYKVPDEIDVRALRVKLGMTQQEFTKFGFSLSAIRHWENKRRRPDGAARVLLKVIENNYEVVLSSIVM